MVTNPPTGVDMGLMEEIAAEVTLIVSTVVSELGGAG